MAGRPPIFNSPEELEVQIDKYFNSVDSKPTITGLALYLGFSTKQSIYDYEKHEEYSYLIKRARLRVENGYEKQLYEGAGSGPIFALKNMGWTDKTEVDSKVAMTINWHEEKTYEANNEAD